MEPLRKAVSEYHYKKSGGITLIELDNGYFAPPADDQCSLCQNAQWSCSTGAHLKTPEHVALKHGLDPRAFIKMLYELEYGPSEFAWKALSYTPSSYLRSPTRTNYVWLPGEVHESKCSDCSDGPEADCMCGLYAFWSPFNALDYWNSEIVAKVLLGGYIIEADRGCRAQYMKIVGIMNLNDDPRAVEMAEVYDVPLVDPIPLEVFDAITDSFL